MKKRFVTTILLASLMLLTAGAQSVDQALFTVNNTPVQLDEFLYIYGKNNAGKANYSRESVEEYLDLYIKFKLKVQKAKQLKLDTIKALKEELAGYRKQLAKSYLVDKEISAKLVEEVYQRKQKDIRVSHIFLGLEQEASPAEQQKVLNKAFTIQKKLKEGADFRLMAQTLSEDKSSASSGGNLGWMTAMLPDGFYEFENAMYSLDIGEVSLPVRSNLGYHLIKVTDIRPARGEIEVAHILVRNKKDGKLVKNSKGHIDSLYQLLKAGGNFDELAVQYSEDKNTAAKGGSLGYFGIGQYDIVFENTAFALSKVGEYSRPVQTSVGWHIIKLLNKKDYSDGDKMKKSLSPLVANNDRFELAKIAMINQIKEKNDFVLHTKTVDEFVQNLDTEFLTYKWQIPEMSPMALFAFGEEDKFTIQDFAAYCKDNARMRLRMSQNTELSKAVDNLLNDFINEQVMKIEEEKLEEKYPDFKALMREYSEGILLFEATKINVWDKAPKDTAGLRKFYEQNHKKYYWNERAVLSTYRIQSANTDLVNKIHQFIQQYSSDSVLAEFNRESVLITHESSKHEVGGRDVENIEWAAGATSRPKFDQRNSLTIIKKIEEILPPAQKSMNEARGYIIADYQDILEEQWVAKLRREFPVSVNREVLNSIIKE